MFCLRDMGDLREMSSLDMGGLMYVDGVVTH